MDTSLVPGVQAENDFPRDFSELREKMRLVKAARIMADFVVLASVDPSKTDDQLDQITGSFVYASMLSCGYDDLALSMTGDLVSAGLLEEPAQEMVGLFTTPNYLAKVASCDFIHEKLPGYGFIMGKETGVNDAKFVSKILELSKHTR